MYNIFFILHFFGSICVFSGAAITFLNMMGMAFTKETKRIWIGSFWAMKMERLWFFSTVLILIASIYMVFSRWGWKFPWIDVSFLMLILMMAGSFFLHRWLKTIHQMASEETENTASFGLIEKVHDRILWNILSITTLEVGGIIHLMIEKFGTLGSLLTFFAILILGLILTKIIFYLANKSNQNNYDQSLS